MSSSVRIAAIQARPVSDLFDDMWNGGDVARAVALLETAAGRAPPASASPSCIPGSARRSSARRRGA